MSISDSSFEHVNDNSGAESPSSREMASAFEEMTSKLRVRNLSECVEAIIAASEEEAAAIKDAAAADAEATRKEMVLWESEKKRVASTHTFEPIVELNAGGQCISTTLATLTSIKDSMLGQVRRVSLYFSS